MNTRKHIKTLVSAAIVIVLSICIIAGQTFALFTSRDSVDISITAGKVNVTANIDENSLKVFSKDVEQTATDVDGKKLFENSGTASFDQNANLVLDRVTPGDKATFNIVVTNNSNVDVIYRVKWGVEGELASALVKTVDGVEITSNKSDWAEWDITTGYKTLALSVELPLDTLDTYQEKTATISYSVEVVQANADLPDEWDGTVDTAWYTDNPDATEYTLSTAEQLAGLAKLLDDDSSMISVMNGDAEELRSIFYGKTIKLDKDFDLSGTKCFDPIGSYRQDKFFDGTFDGQGHTISNLNQNTWALDNGYYYGDLGLGLFGMVQDATIKNLKMDNASISGESAICGTVAATAYGECTFENIQVTNSKCNDYQYYAGGIVGWASGDHQYINCNIDESTTIGGQWGDFGNANGGLIGGIGSSGTYLFKDCTVACRIDAVNDVVSAYQWYCYRNSGMLIGRVPQTITNGEVQTVKTPKDNVTCENVTVIYGDWANYTYCEFAGTGYPYVRVQAGTSVDAYSNVRYGHPTDANGNVVVDDNHTHNDGEAHHELIAFDQLFGGPANHRYCYYGIAEYDGVTVVYNNK